MTKMMKVAVASLCIPLLGGCINKAPVVEKTANSTIETVDTTPVATTAEKDKKMGVQTPVVTTAEEDKEIEVQTIEKNEVESRRSVKTLTIDETVYEVTYNFNSDLHYSYQLWKCEKEGTPYLIDEGTFVDIIEGKEGFYTSAYRYDTKERYIKKHQDTSDDIGQCILEEQIDSLQPSLSLAISSNPQYGLWCVVVEQANKLLLLNEKDEVIFEITKEGWTEEELSLEPYGWSDDGKYLWCVCSSTWPVLHYMVINTQTFEVGTIKNEEAFYRDYALNTNNGWVAYSTMPVFFDAEEPGEFKASGETVTLSIKHLFTKEVIELDTSIAEIFEPKWIGETLLEYNNPNGEGRITYQLPVEKIMDNPS